MTKMTPCAGTCCLRAVLLAGLAWLSAGIAIAASSVPAELPGPGQLIAAYEAPALVNAGDAAYLGLDPGRGFQPAALQAELVLIEVFNVYCASCVVMRPYMNELFARIQADSELQGKVRMLGIAAGNDEWDIKAEEQSYDFPILPDDDYIFHRLVGRPPTPFLIFSRPFSQGRLLVVDSHLGRLEDADALLAMVREALHRDPADLKIRDVVNPATAPRAAAPDIPLPEEQLLEKVKQSMSIGGSQIKDFEKVLLPGWEHVYTGRLAESGQRLFARVVARRIPCIDCHDVFFAYSFDGEGHFLSFVPLSIYKYGNRPWSAYDAEKIQRRFHRQSLLTDVPFNSKVDAVSSATISTELVYDGIAETDQLIEALSQAGRLP